MWRGMNWRETLATLTVCVLCGAFVTAAFFICSDLSTVGQ